MNLHKIFIRCMIQTVGTSRALFKLASNCFLPQVIGIQNFFCWKLIASDKRIIRI